MRICGTTIWDDPFSFAFCAAPNPFESGHALVDDFAFCHSGTWLRDKLPITATQIRDQGNGLRFGLARAR